MDKHEDNNSDIYDNIIANRYIYADKYSHANAYADIHRYNIF